MSAARAAIKNHPSQKARTLGLPYSDLAPIYSRACRATWGKTGRFQRQKKLTPTGASPILGSTERRLLNHVPRVRLGPPSSVRALQNSHEATVICLAIGAAGAPIAGPVGKIALRLGIDD